MSKLTKRVILINLKKKCQTAIGKLLGKLLGETKNTQIRLKQNEATIKESMRSEKLRVVIIDCSSILFIDEAGVNSLRSIIEKYESIGVLVALTNCRGTASFFFYKFIINIL